MSVSRTWCVVGHHHNAREGQFCLTVQRDAVTKVIVVSLSQYALAASGQLQEIALMATKEDIEELERKASALDAVRLSTRRFYDELPASAGGSVDVRRRAGRR